MLSKWRLLRGGSRKYDMADYVHAAQARRETLKHGNHSMKVLLKQARVEEALEEAKAKEPAHGDADSAHRTQLIQGEVCFVRDSPYRILKAAGSGKLGEVERLYKEDPSRLQLQDSKGHTALHQAAKHGHAAVISFVLAAKAEERLLKNREDSKQEKVRRPLLSRFSKKRIVNDFTLSHLDVQNNDGYTPLHLAVLYNQPQAIELLLNAGADANVPNKKGSAAIHTAVFENNTDALLTLCRHPSVDVNLGGERGGTPMHVAAYKDHAECATILLQNGAKLCKPCEVGMLPIHVATLHGSFATLESIMQHAEAAGYTRDEVLKLRDSSQNLPLHTAVNGGDIRAVLMCLKAGAKICDTQDDNSTAIHLAAQQGSLEMIKTMFDAQPEHKDICIHGKDSSGMTPLHKAAVFDRSNVAKYLIEQGANKNDLDSDGMSPVLLAAAKKAWCAVEVLIKSAVDITIRDKKNRNIFHLIISNGGKPEQFSFCMCNKVVAVLTNEADEQGCTPLHYASMRGQLKTVVTLMTLGASLNAKNNNRESPLHFAAGHGRIHTCGRLLSSNNGRSTINETNGDGQTPLHAAAAHGHTQVVLMLMQHGACILRDRLGKTALHLAAEEGYVNTVQSILNVHSHLLNSGTKAGDSCLHLAARRGQPAVVTLLMSTGAAFTKNYQNEHFVDISIECEQREVLTAVVSHHRWDEALKYCSSKFCSPMVGLIRQAPEICQLVLDRCRTSSKEDANCPKFHYTYDFRFLDMDAETVARLRQEKVDYTPLYAANLMVQYNRVNCLSHPVSLAFLKMKWQTYGVWFWVMNLLIYAAFLGSLTSFISNYHHSVPAAYPATSNVTNGTTSPHHWSTTNFAYRNMPVGQKITIIIILVFSILNMIKEVVQMIQQRIKYFMDLNNLLEWVLYITSTVLVAPFLWGVSSPAQWQCGAIAVFLAWFNLLLFLQRFDLYGIYVVMFLEILRTLIQVLIVFSILIIAFGLSFYTLMYTEETNTFASPYMSIMTIIMMMLSNIEYIDSWVNPYSDHNPDTLFFPSLSFFMLAVFILFMPILLMNLLIGLAVGDIEAVQKDATLKRLAMTVELHTDLERKMPPGLLKYIHKPKWIVYPNCKHSGLVKIFQKLTATKEGDLTQKEEDASEDSLIYQELYNQKRRLKKMQTHLDRQYDLLRLIVQKMEIRSEAEDQEEDDNRNDHADQATTDTTMTGVGWTSSTMRTTLLKQASVLAKWGKSVDTFNKE